MRIEDILQSIAVIQTLVAPLKRLLERGD